jgi:DHA2 family multidrug resistance protein
MHLKPHENASASTVLNVMRNLGGAFGIALVATLSDTLARGHLAHIKESLPAVSTQAQDYLAQSASMLQAGGSDPYTAAAQAKALLGKTMSQQAYIQAYNDVFFIMGALLLIAVFAVLLIRKPTGPVAHDAMVE